MITRTVISQKLINLLLNSTKRLILKFSEILYSTKNIPHNAEYEHHNDKYFKLNFFAVIPERVSWTKKY